MKKNLIQKMLMGLIILNPLFDLHFFYGQIGTLIRIIFILVMLFLIFKIDKEDKTRKYLFLYLGITFIYFLIHDLNARQFKSLVPDNFNYSTLKEGLYFLKMVMSPILIYLVYKSKLTIDKLNISINLAVILISGSIVLFNFLGISYNSYGYEPITGSFFTWFTDHNYLFNQLASKGFFELANQIVAILILYLPLVIYFLFKKFNIFNLTTFILLLLSMLMLGTRISIYGSFMALIAVLIIYLFLLITKKEKMNLISLVTIILLSVGFYLLINYSPVKLKSDYYEDIYENQDIDNIEVIDNNQNTGNNQPNNKKVPNNTNKDDIDYIENNYQDKLIYEHFILKSYPYQYDPEFWIDIMDEPVEKRVDTRYLEQEMVEQVVEINDNDLDPYLGITYVRIQNIFNIERDYVMQYYSVGIIGTILLLGSYFVVVMVSTITILKDFKCKFNLTNILLLFSVLLMLLSAYFSGNILNGLGCIIPLSIICGVLINNTKYGKITDENLVKRCPVKEKIEKVISVYKRDGFIETTKKIFKHLKYEIFFKHNPWYLVDFAFNKKRYVKFLDEVLNSNYDRVIIWRGSFGWKVPLFQRPQHIARELSHQKCLVFYSTYKDDKVLTFDKINDNLYLINYQNKKLVKLFEEKLKELNKPKYIQIYSTDWFKSTEDIKTWVKDGYKIIYEYIDDLSPDLTGTKELAKNIIDKYNFCSENSDDVLVVTSADKLYDDIYKIRKDKNVAFSSNGVEYEHFAKVKKEENISNKMLEIVKLDKPIIGYYGALGKWFDYDLIKYISKEKPDYQIVLIGLKYDTYFDKSKIEKLNNVHYLGVIDYFDLPKYAVYFDVATIPFLVNDITKATSPCKLFEYMSLNKPIVTTSLNECYKYKSVMIGKNKKEFVNLLDKSLKIIKNKDKKYFSLLKKEALENTWEMKATLIIDGLKLMEKGE